MSGRKRMVRIPGDPAGAQWTGPVLVRGWFRARRPWRYPLAAAALVVKWKRVRRDVEHAEGFISFEYWLRPESLLFGMHVGWANNEQLQRFDASPSHRDIARWAIASPLIRAMKLVTLAKTDDGRIISLGGFHIYAAENDLPPDALFPGGAVCEG